MSNTRERVTLNADLLFADMVSRGWRATDLARRAKVSNELVSCVFKGENKSPRTWLKLARALGYRTLRRYVVSREAVAS